MSLPTPSTQDISDNIVASIATSIGQSIPLLPKTFTRVMAKALAGAIIILWKYCGFIFLQLFVAYATDEPTTINGKVVRPLIELGRRSGIDDPKPSVQAQLVIDVTVTNLSGSLVANSALVYSSTGVIYHTVAERLLNAATVRVTMRAFSDPSGGDGSGSIGNLQPGDIVEFANAQPNVVSKAVVVAQVVTGADAESTDSYRARLTSRTQAKPQGGAYADYQDWALAVPGIVACYPYASNLPGVVDIYVEADPVSSGSPDGIPTGPMITAVASAIQFVDVNGVATRRPVGAAIRVFPITRTGFTITITGLDPVLTATQDSISDAADEFLRSREPYIEGLSSLPRLDRITELAVGGVVETVVDSAGASVTKISVSPGPAYTLGPGEKAKKLAVNYL